MKTVLNRLMATAIILAGGAGIAMTEEPTVVVEEAWSRASIGVNRPGAAYMTLRNLGDEAEVLTGLRTDLAMKPDIHLTATNSEGVSSMTPAGEIEISPGGVIALEPGGLHVMLMRLQRPMAEGETFSLTLTFADGDEVSVKVPILGITARGPND